MMLPHSTILHAGGQALPMAVDRASVVLAVGVAAFIVLAYLAYRDYQRAVGGDGP